MDTNHFQPKVLLLRMGKVPFMDATGEANLAIIVKHIRNSGGTVLISGVQPLPKAYLKKTGLDQKIGEEHFFEHTGHAITFALSKLDTEKCLGCKHFAFRECAGLSSRQQLEEAVQLQSIAKVSSRNPGGL